MRRDLGVVNSLCNCCNCCNKSSNAIRCNCVTVVQCNIIDVGEFVAIGAACVATDIVLLQQCNNATMQQVN